MMQAETRKATTRGVSPAWSVSGKSVVIMRDVQETQKIYMEMIPNPLT